VSQFIRLYKNILPPSLCSNIIDTYEKLWREQEQEIKEMSLCYNENGLKLCGACDCQRLDIMQHHEMKDHFYQVVHRFQYLVSQYQKDVIADDCQFPSTYKYENFRVKRFLRIGNQQHDTHVDVTNADTAKRFLAFVCYLNDDFDGGQTIFPQYDYQSEVTTGSVLIFPVSWNYLHRGKPITNGYAKYMLGSFLQYEQRQKMDRIGDKTMGLDNTNI
tara:strand:+ start:314 stop:964 length:651 start_codon:yes stop_codon:yes gene_type:complete